MHRRAGLLWPAAGALRLAALAYYLSRPRVLDGAQLYRDIIEINPPLIFYSVVPPRAGAPSPAGRPRRSSSSTSCC